MQSGQRRCPERRGALLLRVPEVSGRDPQITAAGPCCRQQRRPASSGLPDPGLTRRVMPRARPAATRANTGVIAVRDIQAYGYARRSARACASVRAASHERDALLRYVCRGALRRHAMSACGGRDGRIDRVGGEWRHEQVGEQAGDGGGRLVGQAAEAGDGGKIEWQYQKKVESGPENVRRRCHTSRTGHCRPTTKR